MKTLEEIGISPTPWREASYGLIVSSDNKKVADFGNSTYDPKAQDFVMMMSAPKLYNFLRDAVIDVCYGCRYEDDGKCTNEDLDCHVKKWRAALAEASGEEVC